MRKNKADDKSGRSDSILEIEWLLNQPSYSSRFGLQLERGKRIVLADHRIPQDIAKAWVAQRAAKVLRKGCPPAPPKAETYWLQSKKLPREVGARIDSYKRYPILSLGEQIAALLLRSDKFQRESRSGPVEGGFWAGSNEFKILCHRWHLNTKWTGDDRDLAKFIEVGPLAFAQFPGSGGSMLNVGKGPARDVPPDSYGGSWALDLGKATGNYFYIRIDPWTAKEDIDWKKIRDQKERCFGEGFREKSKTFGRDLCWYDLRAKSKMSPRAVADVWKERRNGLLDDLRALVGAKRPWDKYCSEESDARDGRTQFEDTILKAMDRIETYISQIERYAIDFHISVNF